MYQPRWINGREVGVGYRDSSTRYNAVAKDLKKLGTGFRVLDVGAYGGYFSARLTEEFSAKCTAVDSEPELARMSGNLDCVINRRFENPGEIRSLGDFDAVLCLSVLHHVPWWQDMLEAVLDIAGFAYLETPHPDEYVDGHVVSDPEVYRAVSRLGGRVLCRTQGNPSPSNPNRDLVVVRGRSVIA